MISEDPLDTLIEDCIRNNIPLQLAPDPLPEWVPKELQRLMYEKSLTVKNIERVVSHRRCHYETIRRISYRGV